MISSVYYVIQDSLLIYPFLLCHFSSHSFILSLPSYVLCAFLYLVLHYQTTHPSSVCPSCLSPPSYPSLSLLPLLTAPSCLSVCILALWEAAQSLAMCSWVLCISYAHMTLRHSGSLSSSSSSFLLLLSLPFLCVFMHHLLVVGFLPSPFANTACLMLNPIFWLYTVLFCIVSAADWHSLAQRL